MTMLPTISKAPWQANVEGIISTVGDLKDIFIELGLLLHENRRNKYYLATGELLHTFKDFCELYVASHSYSWACKLADMGEVLAKQQMTRDTVLEIGPTKMALLVSHIKDGTITDDLIELAKHGSARDLREALGLRVGGGGLCICPACGESRPCPRGKDAN